MFDEFLTVAYPFSGGKYARTNFIGAPYMMMYDNTTLPDNQDSCLSFWYHMQGRYPGKLEVGFFA